MKSVLICLWNRRDDLYFMEKNTSCCMENRGVKKHVFYDKLR